MRNKKHWLLTAAFISSGAFAQSDEDTAKQLVNPVAAVVSLPFQFGYDENYGFDDEGSKFFINVQPVIPFAVNDDWNVITRTIMPIVSQKNLVPNTGTQFGISDTTFTAFFSPKKPTSSGMIWGLGPVLLMPTGSDDYMTTKKWGLGPAGVLVSQKNSWTTGLLANHVWSFAGDDERDDISSTFMQPFLNYTTPTAVTFFLNTESTYNWEQDVWSVPINAGVNKLFTFGSQKVSLGLGLRYWANSPESGPEGLGGRINMTFVFPQ